MSLNADLKNDFSGLSIVIQGPTELSGLPIATLAARTARDAFPGAEVILSSWCGDQIDKVRNLVDKLVLSVDPGPQHHSAGVLNINRQIISSRAGVGVATRPYVLKARSDLIFRDSRLWTEYHAHQRLFRTAQGHDPILITNLTTINPRRQERYFALCDWIYLGPRDKMVELVATPPFPDDYLTYQLNGESLLRFNAEQWIVVNFLARYGLDLDTLPNGYVTGATIARVHSELVGRYFALTSWFRLGLGTQKHRIATFSLDEMYTHREWAEEFFDRHKFLDPERMIISAVYHPLIRATAKRLRKLLIA